MADFRTALAAVLFVATAAFAAPPAPSALTGEWQGTFRFYEAKLAAKGTVPIRFSVAADGTLTGQVGGAKLAPSRPRATKEHLEFSAPLDGRVRDDVDKVHAIVLVTRAEGGKLEADLHLKSRAGLDLVMHPGEVRATRAP